MKVFEELCNQRATASESKPLGSEGREDAKLLKIIGGSVCESNAPLTSKTPIAGFEDREDHRTPFASVLMLPVIF